MAQTWATSASTTSSPTPNHGDAYWGWKASEEYQRRCTCPICGSKDFSLDSLLPHLMVRHGTAALSPQYDEDIIGVKCLCGREFHGGLFPAMAALADHLCIQDDGCDHDIYSGMGSLITPILGNS
jgi:hypothetical protein